MAYDFFDDGDHMDQYDSAVYATQGGGYATYDSTLRTYVWHSEIPAFVTASVGDPIPDEWGVTGPINLED